MCFGLKVFLGVVSNLFSLCLGFCVRAVLVCWHMVLIALGSGR